MPLSDVITREAIIAAITEYINLGGEMFLSIYGFGPARNFFLVYDGREYPSKAIVGVARKFDCPEKGPMKAGEFVGGKPIQAKLESLGFTVKVRRAGGAGIRTSINKTNQKVKQTIQRWDKKAIAQPAGRRLADIDRFYQLLETLQNKTMGFRYLATATGGMNWSRRGVYFFFDPGEVKTNSGVGYRVVRVGTHALIIGAKATLWDRLKAHKGIDNPPGGNHRGSVFRKHIGRALLSREYFYEDISRTWGVGNAAPKDVKEKERPLEIKVSKYIRKMPFLWLKVDDPPGPNSLRGYIERNAIGLLSNYQWQSRIDPPNENWLGNWSDKIEIRESGLWNVMHVGEKYDPQSLEVLGQLIENM